MKFLIVLPLLVASAYAGLAHNHLLVPTQGESPKVNDGRIIQGQTAASGQFPYQVGLLLTGIFLSNWCGGSLIHPEWVLTAAHCLTSKRTAAVYLGATERLRPELSITVQRDGLFYHADFNIDDTAQNDIGLIRLPSPVKLTRKIHPISLPRHSEANDVLDGEPAVVSGWGKTTDNSNVANMLQYVTLRIANGNACEMFGPSFTEKNICIETNTDRKSTCQGDSGGPLVLTKNDVLVGIVSYGSRDGCEGGFPIGFTRVASFLDWIEQISGLKF